MKEVILKVRALGTILSLLLLCSCATSPPPATILPATELPAEADINEEAGRGGHLIVPLHLENGDELPFMFDTGSPITLLDKSLESRLGKRRARRPISFAGGDQEQAGFYAAPRLYLGKTKLITGSFVAVHDFNAPSSRTHSSVMGILGMDCLRHYCIQLDFETEKIRFLKPQVEAAELGRAFPLNFFQKFYPQVQRANFAGDNTNLLIDIGCNIDAIVNTNVIHGLAVLFPEQEWGGEIYTNLLVASISQANALGLRFLARHLATFDFPRSTMYLKQKSVGPLAGDTSLKGSHFGDLQSPIDFLSGLQGQGQLPGWSKEDQEPIYLEACSNSAPNALKSVTFGFQRRADSFCCRYLVERDSENSPWRLRRAWRTDQSGQTIQGLAIP